MTKMLIPSDVDRILNLPRGRSERMAKRGKLPHIVLPTGEIRFTEEAITRIVQGTEGSSIGVGKAVSSAD